MLQQLVAIRAQHEGLVFLPVLSSIRSKYSTMSLIRGVRLMVLSRVSSIADTHRYRKFFNLVARYLEFVKSLLDAQEEVLI
jgi:hypothetical protein